MIEIPLTQVPFSAFRAWMSISPIRETHHAPQDASALYLRSHHGKTMPLMGLTPILPEAGGSTTVRAEPSLLRWTAPDGGFVEACFDGVGLRFRGHGLGLRLEPLPREYFAVLYCTHPDQVSVNILDARRQYRLERIQGRLEARGLWHAETQDAAVLECLPDQTGAWEVALDEFESTWTPRDRASFEACLAASRASFARWLEATPPAPPEYTEARALGAYINWSSTVGECGLLKRPTMLMSKNWMSSVWSWDHCFNALSTARTMPEFAWNQMLVMADHQDEHGCYPDSINDVECVFNFSKPPVHGLTVHALLERVPHTPAPHTLKAMYDSICRWSGWWLGARRAQGEILPHYLHGNDSGWDNSTMFDAGVPLIAPDLAAFLAVQLEVQSDLAVRLGLHGEAERWRRESERLLDALLSTLWRDDRFVARRSDGSDVTSQSLQYCLPIVLGDRLPEMVRRALTDRIRELLTDHGLATEHPESPRYQPDGYWRGPIWAPSSYLIALGLEAIGETELALTIARRFCEMCAQNGFAENFEARSGVGLRDRAYTWTASVFALFSEKLARTG